MSQSSAGNVSEIRALAGGTGQESGVEADLSDRIDEDNLAESAAWLRDFCASYRHSRTADRCDGRDHRRKTHRSAVRRQRAAPPHHRGRVYAHLALPGVYCGAAPDRLFEAAVTASEVMKHCGEIAEARVRKEMEGTASFRTRLIDAVSLLNADELTPNLCLQIL